MDFSKHLPLPPRVAEGARQAEKILQKGVMGVHPS